MTPAPRGTGGPARLALGVGLLLLGASASRAQGLPGFAPINPVAASRSGLRFEPYRDPHPRLRVSLALDYASAIEAPVDRPDYVLDAELLRLGLGLERDLGRDLFVLGELEVLGSYGGFLDRFVDAYHHAFGIPFVERAGRPRNRFAYLVPLPGGGEAGHAASALNLGDTRLGLGWRWRSGLQSLIAVTLPTATGPAGYGRDTVSLALTQTWRARLHPRLTYEGSAGLGFTPRQGELAEEQERTFASLTSGVRIGLWGTNAIGANVFYHSPYYHDTRVRQLDRYDLDLDLAWMHRTAGGAEWRVGLTEDLKVSGPAIDLILRLGLRF